MNRDQLEVAIVLARDYAARLIERASSGPVWAIDSEANKGVAQEFWDQFPLCSHLDGITIFSASSVLTPEEILMAEFANIDEHFGYYSAEPPYTAVHVFGATASAKVREALSEYGFDSFSDTEDGFRAFRLLPLGPPQ